MDRTAAIIAAIVADLQSPETQRYLDSDRRFHQVQVFVRLGGEDRLPTSVRTDIQMDSPVMRITRT